MTKNSAVHDEWNTYVAQRDDVTMFISFDEEVTRGEPPADLGLCARVMIPIAAPNESGGPSNDEAQVLWDMEDELCGLLDGDKIRCRLVGRLTYAGWRELVFQLNAWEPFRPPVGMWMTEHEDYEIDVSEHEGWEFFDDYIRPREEDRIWMSDRSVVDNLIKNGSDPEKPHELEYVFLGEGDGLAELTEALLKRGYQRLADADPQEGQVVLVKSMPLDVFAITEESLANLQAAEDARVECDGWGALVVK